MKGLFWYFSYSCFSITGRNHHHIYFKMLQTAPFCKQHFSTYIFLSLVKSYKSDNFYPWKKKRFGLRDVLADKVPSQFSMIVAIGW